MIIFNFF